MNTPSKIIIPGSASGPILNEHGTEKFARKDKIYVPPDTLSNMSIKIPPLYYWEDVEGGESYQMTMAFKIHNLTFGMSYPIEDNNVVKVDIMRKKLFGVVKESLDVLVHHGTKVLDDTGNIDPRLVNDEEAIRFRFDPHWDKKVAAFNQLVRIVPITKKKAVQLGLLTERKGLHT